MPKTFSLSSLLPEPTIFVDDGSGGDGTRYDVRVPAMFNTLEFAKIERLQADLPAALAAIAASNEASTDTATVRAVDQLVNEMFRLLVPDMPLARIEQIGFTLKYGFIEWWKAEQEREAQQQVGEVRAGKPIRGRRSPASSTPTA